jgi:hypothetical protein
VIWVANEKRDEAVEIPSSPECLFNADGGSEILPLGYGYSVQGQTGLPMGAIHEFCFLQLRMLCELIALGCLTAHGDLETGKLKKTYEAHKIIHRLRRLHPHFYPLAAKQTKPGRNAILLKDGFLTREELVNLYVKCGKVLHRGSSIRALSSLAYEDRDFGEIGAWKKKIEVLLNFHAMFMSDNKTLVLFTLWNNANNNQVGWVTLEREGMVSILRGGE